MATTLTDSTETPELPARQSRYGLDHHGIRPRHRVLEPERRWSWWSTPSAAARGNLVDGGPFNAVTAPHTGRSPNDRFVVREPGSEGDVDWGKVNLAIDPAQLRPAARRGDGAPGGTGPVRARHVGGRRPGVPAGGAGGDAERVAQPVRLQHVPPSRAAASWRDFQPGFTILHAPEFQADPARHGTRTSTFILINFGRSRCSSAARATPARSRSAIFGVLNYLLPHAGRAARCTARPTWGRQGDTALFFGLSRHRQDDALRRSRSRALIGDDEHGWSDDGVFNFEGGCYAKAIRLSPRGRAARSTPPRACSARVLENVRARRATRRVGLRRPRPSPRTPAPATRCDYIPNYVPSGAGRPPEEHRVPDRRRLRRAAAASRG